MKKGTRFVCLDVHKDTIAVAVAEAETGGEVRSLGTIPNEGEALRRLIRKLEGPEGLHVCYEAGPCGYVLYWQLAKLGVRCDVVAPTLIPVKAGDRVKTDRRDAEKLARGVERLCESTELRKRLGLAGQETMRRYTWAQVTEQLEKVFLLAARSGQT